jgi:hypothetical protein
MVEAVSQANGQASASATVTIYTPVTVSISPMAAEVIVGEQQQFQANVTGTSTTGVNWSVSGTGCTGSACGTINSSGLYTAPSTVPVPPQVLVTATSVASSSAMASAKLTILITNNQKLNGSYAYLLKGFDSNGVFQEAGSIQADGNGNIVSGLEDVNFSFGPLTQLPVTGTYQVESDNRGTLTLNDILGTHTFTFALNGNEKIGRLISFDQTGLRVSGVLLRQDPTAFNTYALAGGFALSLSGMDSSGARVGALGLIYPDGSSFVAGDSLDVNEGGNVNPTFASWAGTYTVDSTGRGTMTWTVPGFDDMIFDFALYIVSANEFLLVSTDPIYFGNPVFSGAAYLQSGSPYLTESFNGTSAFEAAGADAAFSEAMVGAFLFDGNSNVTQIYDQNRGGTVSVDNVMTGAYSLELNGRGSLTLVNPTNGQTRLWDIYAIAPNQALVLDASTDSAATGEMLPQLSLGSFSNADIVGTSLFATDEVVDPASSLQSGEMTFDGGNSASGAGTVTGAEDINLLSGLSSNVVVDGTYSLSSVSNNGRGSILLTLPSPDTLAIWYASQSEFFGLDLSTSNTHPTVLHFEQ